jgi:hypothetical protein
MTTENAAILDRLAAGHISAEEAARLLRRPAAPGMSERLASGGAGQWLNIRVTDLNTDRPRASLRLPLSWVAAGLSLAARYKPEVAGLDLNEMLIQLRTATNGKIVEVEDLEDSQRVEIFVD